MKFSNVVSAFSFVIGIIIVIIGFYLRLTGKNSTGYSTTRYGGLTGGTISVNGFILIGVFVLLISFWTYRIYVSDKKKSELKKQIEEEEKEMTLEKKRAIKKQKRSKKGRQN